MFSVKTNVNVGNLCQSIYQVGWNLIFDMDYVFLITKKKARCLYSSFGIMILSASRHFFVSHHRYDVSYSRRVSKETESNFKSCNVFPMFVSWKMSLTNKAEKRNTSIIKKEKHSISNIPTT